MDKPELLMRKPMPEILLPLTPLAMTWDIGMMVFPGPGQSKRNKENKKGFHI